MSVVDRMADGYEPNHDIDREVGSQGELFVANIVETLKTGSLEVKHDVRALHTGNVYIEYECRTRRGWKPSGIASTKAELWCQVIALNGLAIIVSTAALQRVVERHRAKGHIRDCTRGSHPTRAVVLPLPQFVAEVAYELRREVG